MIKADEFVKRLCDAAKNYKTVYVQGAFGAPMVTEPWDNVGRYTVRTKNKYNLKHAKEIQAVADKGYFAFDCVCLVKGILWGWCGDAKKVYGGARYKSNGVPDIGTEQIIRECDGVSTDFSDIVPGELLHVPGHVGVYVGGGLAVECTPAWDGGVQFSAVGNIGKKAGYHTRVWREHGRLPYVGYVAMSKPAQKQVNITVPMIKRGDKGETVKSLQALLNMRSGARLDIDGSCGAKTDAAIRAFQKARGLTVDGICGAATWDALIGG